MVQVNEFGYVEGKGGQSHWVVRHAFSPKIKVRTKGVVPFTFIYFNAKDVGRRIRLKVEYLDKEVEANVEDNKSTIVNTDGNISTENTERNVVEQNTTSETQVKNT